jgi:hypothetical protein
MKFILLVIALLVLAGCSSSETPDTYMEISTKSLKVEDKILSEFMTVTIIRKDDGLNESTFRIVFPKDSENVYPTDVDGNKITELRTKPLRGKNAQDVLQFKIYGTNLDFEETVYKLPLELRWNDTVLESQQITINVIR